MHKYTIVSLTVDGNYSIIQTEATSPGSAMLDVWGSEARERLPRVLAIFEGHHVDLSLVASAELTAI